VRLLACAYLLAPCPQILRAAAAACYLSVSMNALGFPVLTLWVGC